MDAKTWHPTTPAITAEELPGALQCHRVVVVHFWAVWNGYDRQMDAQLQAERTEFEEQIAFFSLDTDVMTEDTRDLLQECRVLNLPALGCFIHGRHHETVIGMVIRPSLPEKLRQWERLARETDAR